MLTEPLHTRGAPGEGEIVKEQDKFLDRYYHIRGWTQDGIPTPIKLKELKLDYIVSDIPRSSHT
jgi:aldehyde:ferredoxin oxidoreductase